MAFKLPPLPYAVEALQPYMSARTLALHHGKHHAGHVTRLNELTTGTAFESMSLDQVVRASHPTRNTQGIFNNAAQHWNHSRFWSSMKPDGGGAIPGVLERRLAAEFGSVSAFKQEFVAQGMSQFGSGWVWLVEVGERFSVLRTSNAVTPMIDGHRVLLVCDVWEHTYYIDYENRRADFLKVFLDYLVDWEAAAAIHVADAGQRLQETST